MGRRRLRSALAAPLRAATAPVADRFVARVGEPPAWVPGDAPSTPTPAHAAASESGAAVDPDVEPHPSVDLGGIQAGALDVTGRNGVAGQGDATGRDDVVDQPAAGERGREPTPDSDVIATVAKPIGSETRHTRQLARGRDPAAIVVDLGPWDPDRPRLPSDVPTAPTSPFPRAGADDGRSWPGPEGVSALGPSGAHGAGRPANPGVCRDDQDTGSPTVVRPTTSSPILPRPVARPTTQSPILPRPVVRPTTSSPILPRPVVRPTTQSPILPPPTLPDVPMPGPSCGPGPSIAPLPAESAWPGAPIGWEPQEVDTRGLLATDWMRPLVLFAQALLFPSLIAGWPILAFAVVATVAVQALWWATATENARRARPTSPHRVPPGPLQAVVWWLVPLAYTACATVVLVVLDEWSDGSSGASVDRDVVLLVARIALFVGGVAAWYWPYGRLVRVARWIGASSPTVRRWFWLPVVVAVIMAIQIVLLSLSVLGGFGQESGSRTIVVVSTWVAAIAPIAATLVTGRRALLEVDGAAKETYQKRAMPPLDPAEFIARRERLFARSTADAEADPR